MSDYIQGQEILRLYGIRDFELFEYVKKGLQPYSETGKPILPPDVQQKIASIEIEIGKRHDEGLRLWWDLTSGKASVKAFERISQKDAERRLMREQIELARGAHWRSRIAPTEKKLKETKRQIKALTDERSILKDDPSWKDRYLPDSETDRKMVLQELVSAFYLRGEVEKSWSHRKDRKQRTRGLLQVFHTLSKRPNRLSKTKTMFSSKKARIGSSNLMGSLPRSRITKGSGTWCACCRAGANKSTFAI